MFNCPGRSICDRQGLTIGIFCIPLLLSGSGAEGAFYLCAGLFHLSTPNIYLSLLGISGRAQHVGEELAKDLLLPSSEEEKRRHKKKRLVQSPNSYFMDVKCPGCYKITTVFSHAQTVVLCVGCSTVLCQPTGGKARLTEGCSFRRKQH
uniref:40S ribosomal protein S27 n=2 Tax=Xenopus TaxID=8353 RepID=F6W3I0_XENTR